MRRKGCTLLVAAMGLLALAPVTFGQTAPSTSNATQPAASSANLQEITVTGSRIIRDGLDTPAPLTDVSMAELFDVHPGTAGAMLNDLPQFSGSRGLSTNPSNGSFGSSPAAPNPSANILNLRNMGYTRTLILYDGKRMPPSASDGTVDVNMIPQTLLNRVEIVTGGAAAVYGSDSVTGVVNFIPDKRFAGFKVSANAGMSSRGDGLVNDVAAEWGTNLFGGRGHLEMSFANHGDHDILLRSERPWGRNVWTVQGAGTVANPYHLVANTRIGTSSFGGLIVNGALSGQQFAQNGILSPFVHGTATGTAGFESGGDGAFYNSSFKAAQQLDQLFARLDYDVSSSVSLSASLAANYNGNATIGQNSLLANGTISAQNAFLSPDYQAALASAGQPTFRFNKVWTDVPAWNTQTWERNYFAVLELKGLFGSGYTWDAWYTRGETRQDTKQAVNINNMRLAAALDAVIDPASGQIVCAVTISNPALYPGCVPLNVFGPTSASNAAIDYIVTPTRFLSTQTQDDVSAILTGAPFSSWAGPINLALSAEWRRNSWSLESNAQPNDPVSCVNLRYNCSASTLAWANGSTPSRSPVSEMVTEGAVELDIPLAVNAALAKDLRLNGAARHTHYSTIGDAVTWKAAFVWRLNDQFTLRGTRSRDIRAPTLSDVYLPNVATTVQLTDRLTGVTSPVTLIAGGNPNLKPEIGYTTTIGLIYRPEWLENFTLSLDAYRITIADAITLIQGASPNIQDACYASGGTSPYCLLQQRPNGFTDTSSANAVTGWSNEQINIARQHSQGADFEARYAAHPFGHPLTLHALVTYQPHIVYATPGLQTIDVGGVAFSSNALQASPVWRATLIGSYRPARNLTVQVMERWRSSLDWTGIATQIVSTPKIPSVAYTNLSLAYDVQYSSNELQLFLNVQNLFNKQPPAAAFLGANTQVGFFGGFAYGDDPIGTYFTLGMRFRM